MSIIKVTAPGTFYIRFTFETPRKFVLRNEHGEIYYFRFLDGKTPRIKFNLLHAGEYTGTCPFEVVKVCEVEKPGTMPGLPPYERNRVKDFVIVDNLELEGTPARIFTQIPGEDMAVIEKGKNFRNFCKPVRLFFLLHEVGHFFYETEEYCDLFALTHYLNMGYNRSMAFYSLSRVLKRTPQNLNRLKFLLTQIKKTQ